MVQFEGILGVLGPKIWMVCLQLPLDEVIVHNRVKYTSHNHVLNTKDVNFSIYE